MKLIFSDNNLWSLLHFRGKIIKGLKNAGHEIIIVAPYEDIDEDTLLYGVEYVYPKLDRTNQGLINEAIYIKDLYRIYKKYKPEFIFHYTTKPVLYGSIIARLLSIPSVGMLAGTGELFGSKKKFKYCVALLLMRLSLSFAKKILLLNSEDEQTLISERFVNPSQVIVLDGGEGVDTEYYCPDTEYKPNHHRKFIMVARVLYDKGYYEYVEVAKRIKQHYPESEFLLLGYLDTNHPHKVPRSVVLKDQKCGYIKYLGTVTDIPSILGKCDCFVLPSFYNEGMNRSLMEAISMGKVIVTTNNKGCRDMVINNENGYLVKPKDVESLYDAIFSICNLSDEKMLEMGRKSRELAVRRFSIDKVMLKYLQLIND
ncbi:glycosyltransferase family 4 protein [Bacteroides eggerthii]|jgi:hypothetical protein|uniref:Capsular polysaccharide biosynthesis glycosyltransferase n=1 Tax=Bacteroides eggerthii TaxID=28111 RepID=A0A380YLI0_9BACE|nr:glycosyltransferase family 4 protein [Bacteroides eggerthii]EEC53562.1 glycosyltransferase, group 1 family protein [Bacteroides eggerthii DSM 20697]QRQ47482.1 glycosyltransferase family 4 protein [Bacteroides eggerthii]UWN86970.1 glycosyltransferase family 4 protein [Bacteroides eggerthii]SUV29373.1 capsular polysaccharide biosynthesis glycosyltransferase [Bacteroides eggerthii]